MTLEVLNLIYLIHKAPFKEEAQNKIAFTTAYCTRVTYVDNYLKIPIVVVFRSGYCAYALIYFKRFLFM